MVYGVSQETPSNVQLACWQTSDNRRLSVRIPQTSDFFNDPAFGRQNIGSEKKNRPNDGKAKMEKKRSVD